MDLKHLAHNNPHISGLRNMLSHEVRPWLEEVTGIKLIEEIDLFFLTRITSETQYLIV